MKKEKILEVLFLSIGVGIFSTIFYFLIQFAWAIIKSVF
jgi:hypothetical protein